MAFARGLQAVCGRRSIARRRGGAVGRGFAGGVTVITFRLCRGRIGGLSGGNHAGTPKPGCGMRGHWFPVVSLVSRSTTGYRLPSRRDGKEPRMSGKWKFSAPPGRNVTAHGRAMGLEWAECAAPCYGRNGTVGSCRGSGNDAAMAARSRPFRAQRFSLGMFTPPKASPWAISLRACGPVDIRAVFIIRDAPFFMVR